MSYPARERRKPMRKLFKKVFPIKLATVTLSNRYAPAIICLMRFEMTCVILTHITCTHIEIAQRKNSYTYVALAGKAFILPDWHENSGWKHHNRFV